MPAKQISTKGGTFPVVEIGPAPPDVLKEQGELSHGFRLHNVGNLVARSVILSIRTHQDGKTLHEDRSDGIGDMVIKGAIGYVVHLGESTTAMNAEILEDIEISYRGDGGLSR
jgi:hypothetical protein